MYSTIYQKLAKNRKIGQKNHLKSFSLKPLCQFGPNLAGMVLGWSPLKVVSDDPAHQPRWPPWLKIENSAKKSLKIFFSETTVPIWTKLGSDGPWVVPFKSCIRRPHLPIKIATIAKNRKFSKNIIKNLLL